jgi:hypothetical protein
LQVITRSEGGATWGAVRGRSAYNCGATPIKANATAIAAVRRQRTIQATTAKMSDPTAPCMASVRASAATVASLNSQPSPASSYGEMHRPTSHRPAMAVRPNRTPACVPRRAA